jgi:hypothetical protein
MRRSSFQGPGHSNSAQGFLRLIRVFLSVSIFVCLQSVIHSFQVYGAHVAVPVVIIDYRVLLAAVSEVIVDCLVGRMWLYQKQSLITCGAHVAVQAKIVCFSVKPFRQIH